jgi:valyl-tRNA synthetase
MSDQLSLAVRTAFKNMYEKGLIYRGKFIVNWCPVDKTALSDSEVETKDGGEPGHLWYFKYPRTDGKGHVVIATTRPETMLGDTAVAVHPEDERYKDLIGKTVTLPIVNRELAVIADEYVDPEFGSGVVKMTPAHDPNDFEIGVRHNLEMINVMNEDATINENAPEAYQGLNRFKARKKIVAEMESLGLLDKVEERMTPVGRSYRSKEIIEYRLSDQWFMKMRPLAEASLERSQKDELKFYPDRWDGVYRKWLEGVRDWCVSRQLWWGHQIPAWHNKETGEILVDVDMPDAVKQNPDSWKQDPDVLDTWFSSALWPYSTLGWPEQTADLERFYPTNVLVTGKDIIPLWVARMVMTGLFHMEEMPYSDVLINSIICDGDGETMSKSKGNGIDPLHIIDGATKEDLTGPVYEARPRNLEAILKRIDKTYPDGFPAVGADAMRYTLLTTATDAQQLNVSLGKFSEVGRPLTDKLWNASKLVISLIGDVPTEGEANLSAL